MAMHKGEADFTRKLIKWLEYNMGDICYDLHNILGPIEVKYSYTRRFSLTSGIKKGQVKNLLKAQNGAVAYKISDLARINARPWDLCTYFKSRPCFIFQWDGYNKKDFYIIWPEVIRDMIKDGVKSITERDAKLICYKMGVLN